jgi:hypothetical protein
VNSSLTIDKHKIDDGGLISIPDAFLSWADAARVCRVLEKLTHHGLRHFHLTGGLALETHRAAAGCHRAAFRALNDLDIVVPSFADVPDTLMRGFLVRHIHPGVPEGKIVVQLVDAEEALRIDLFSPYGATLVRSQSHDSPVGAIPVVSVEDLAARNASLVMDLERGHEVARKHADDFQWLAELADPGRVEIAWQDHRKASDPFSFKQARERIRDLVQLRAALLVIPAYSQDGDAICSRCEEVGAWRLASGQDVMSILGYG